MKCSFRTVVHMGTCGRGQPQSHGGISFSAALREASGCLVQSICTALSALWFSQLGGYWLPLTNHVCVHKEQVGSWSSERDLKGKIAGVWCGPHCYVLRSKARLNSLLSQGCGDFSKFSSLQNVSLSSQCSTPFTGGVLQAEKKMWTHCEGKII